MTCVAGARSKVRKEDGQISSYTEDTGEYNDIPPEQASG